jgi:hypothetical protein
MSAMKALAPQPDAPGSLSRGGQTPWKTCDKNTTVVVKIP